MGRGTRDKGEELTPKWATILGRCLREQETKSEVLENLSSGQLRILGGLGRAAEMGKTLEHVLSGNLGPLL